MRTIPYAIDVEPRNDYTLIVVFDNGERRMFDVKPYFSDNFFAPLKNPSIFNTAKVNPISIGWINDIDIAPEELYLHSIPV